MSRARILAVDDQRYFRERIEGSLQEEGYDVKTAVESMSMVSRVVP